MADVALGHLVVGEVERGQPWRCSISARRTPSSGWRPDADEDMGLGRVGVAVVELGDVAAADQRAELLEGAGLLGDGDGARPRAARPPRRARRRSAGGRSSCWRRRRWRPGSCPAGCVALWRIRPATASARAAGSRMERVSSNTSLIAAQMASVSTRSSRRRIPRHRRKVSPTSLTAAVGEQADVVQRRRACRRLQRLVHGVGNRRSRRR